MNFIKRNIPNAITCGNLLCGCLAIVKAFEGNLVWAAYLVGIAAVLDFFDGFAARLLKVSSPIGKDLDSLADMVTFGVVPGVMMYKMILLSLDLDKEGFDFLDSNKWLVYIVFIIPVFSAIRLAKFNNDTRQTDSFIGLPTPANAIFICSLAIILVGGCYYSDRATNDFYLNGDTKLFRMLANPFVLVAITLIFSFLLVAELPLFSLKFKHLKWKGNEIRFVFLLLAVIMLVLLKFVGIPLTIILYILLSVVSNIINKKKIA